MLSYSRAAISTGALAALLTLAGGAVAAAAPAAAGQAPAAAAARHGHEQFRLTSNVADASSQHVQATGVLTAQGHAVLGPKRGNRQVTWLDFGNGSVRLVTEPTSSSGSPPDPTTCKFTEVYSGNYQVRGGNRRYVHAAGSGTYVTRIAGRLERKNGNCTSTLAAFRQTTTTAGSLSW
jgi:hypothetical protein